MDVSEYMKKKLGLLERIAVATETLASQGALTVVQSHSCGKTTAAAEPKSGEKEKAAPKAETAAQPAGTAGAGSTTAETSAPSQEAPTAQSESEQPAKKVTADDARKALKEYAAVEGNEAAMELLTSLGGASVSALAEQGADKLAELVEKCRGVA